MTRVGARAPCRVGGPTRRRRARRRVAARARHRTTPVASTDSHDDNGTHRRPCRGIPDGTTTIRPFDLPVPHAVRGGERALQQGTERGAFAEYPMGRRQQASPPAKQLRWATSLWLWDTRWDDDNNSTPPAGPRGVARVGADRKQTAHNTTLPDTFLDPFAICRRIPDGTTTTNTARHARAIVATTNRSFSCAERERDSSCLFTHLTLPTKA